MTEDRPIRLLSYNIRKALGTDRRRDPMRIVRVLSHTQADIVLLQEADLRLGNRPAVLSEDALGDIGLAPLAVADTDVSMGWHGNAILLRADWTARQITRIPLPGFEPRGAVSAIIDTPQGPLRVIGLHIGLLRRSRVAQQNAILAWIADQSDIQTILAGDLNEWTLHRGLGPFAKSHSLHAPGRSYHARWRLAPLDRIAVDRRLDLIDTGMIDTKLTRAASDHLPIYADLEPGSLRGV
ncbi:endonuclease/exonuclease/phosphatase family protein [Loktanella sp. TSTF-M6]|uniref:Endonuclease/exonuclease/phosphatase family protein n=1 Tax=Loktanella gaetbuli TaxID=2881335 RepID=A0ABS8BU74_9RHOB|nr:endonuclease/exonuclease/phosphatase family protein [Loktanella gaetbuli]MCB5199278.1 endonuclease/exonuclease/phosphatase family protein [Loktanella gaetbuli]